MYLSPVRFGANRSLKVVSSCRADTDLFAFRNIKNFMVQTGDPTGTGKGGQSIWGQPFADEIKPTLRVRLLDQTTKVGVANELPSS